uniref:SAM domain-containing protein n=1 Tax=Rhabditophanes sp. KR3021 TaxID=114890 RepID=A0AC35U947_9BILA
MGNKNSRTVVAQYPDYRGAPHPYGNMPGVYLRPGAMHQGQRHNSAYQLPTGPTPNQHAPSFHQSMHCLNQPDQSQDMVDNKVASRLSLNECGRKVNQTTGGLAPPLMNQQVPLLPPRNSKVPQGYFIVQGPPMNQKELKKWHKKQKKMMKKMSASRDTIMPYPVQPIFPIMTGHQYPVMPKMDSRALSLDNLNKYNQVDGYEQLSHARLSDNNKKGNSNKNMHRKSYHYDESESSRSTHIKSSDYLSGPLRISSAQSNPRTGTLSDYHNQHDQYEDTSSGIVCTASESSGHNSTPNKMGNLQDKKSNDRKNRGSVSNSQHVTEDETSLNASFDSHMPAMSNLKINEVLNEEDSNSSKNHQSYDSGVPKSQYYGSIIKRDYNSNRTISSLTTNTSSISSNSPPNHIVDPRTSTPYKQKRFPAPTPPKEDVETSPKEVDSVDRISNPRSMTKQLGYSPQFSNFNSSNQTPNYSHPRSEVSEIDFSWVKEVENGFDKESSKVVPNSGESHNHYQQPITKLNMPKFSQKVSERKMPAKYFGMESPITEYQLIEQIENHALPEMININHDYSFQPVEQDKGDLQQINSNVRSKAAMFDNEAIKNEQILKEERESAKYLLKNKKGPPSYSEHLVKHQNNHQQQQQINHHQQVNHQQPNMRQQQKYAEDYMMPYIPKPDYYSSPDTSSSEKVQKIYKANNQSEVKLPTKYQKYHNNTRNISNSMSELRTRMHSDDQPSVTQPWKAPLAC